jgi:DNA-binding NarL/FixJ family response regulator
MSRLVNGFPGRLLPFRSLQPVEALMTVPQKRILIADAHPTMTASVRLLLKDMFDVSVMVADVQSLSDAVVRSDFDLVIADLSIPRKSDENVVQLLKRVRPDLRLIILSVNDEQVAIDECLSAGAQGFVLKRSAVDDLVPAVEAVMQDETYVSPSLRKANGQ